jgi:hypothetical protein
MKKQNWFLKIAVCTSALLPLLALNSWADDDRQLWMQMNLIKRFQDTPWQAVFEVQPRHSNDERDVQFTLIRPYIDYIVNPALTLSAGYLGLIDQNEDEVEQRWWLQALLRHDGDWGFVNLRLRPEFRKWTANGDRGQRLRVMPRVQVRPFSKGWLKEFSPYTANEAFLEYDPVVGRTTGGWNQNRFFLGLNRAWTPSFATDFAYLNVVLDRPTPRQTLRDHNLWVSLTYRF